MTEEPIDLTENEFLAFCLAYASKCDNVIVNDEEKHIKCLVGAEVANKAYSLLAAFDDVAQLKIISSYRDRYFPTPADKGRLLGHMEDLFLSDNFYHPLEKTTLSLLEEVL